MEQADQTLHDFVLNLLSDTQALAAFEQDPAAVLDLAGLSDISAADVQEVIPLVIDYVPAHAETLDALLSQLPLDSLETGQLGAIQQLQFVTQALGGIPTFADAGTLGNSVVNGFYQLNTDAEGGVWGHAGVESPLGGVAASLTGDVERGLNLAAWDHSGLGHGTADLQVPGLDSVPSGFTSLGDVTDLLDGTTASTTVGNAATAAANLLSGAADLTAGALANPTDLAGALNNPVAAVSALAGTGETFALAGTEALPAPLGDTAGQVVQTVGTDVQSVTADVTSHVATGPLGDVSGQLPVDPTHALSTVHGVVDQVTGSLGTGSLGSITDVTSHLTDPTHALQSTVTSVQSVVSDTVGNVASHSAVSDVTSTTGAGSLLGSGDHTDVTGELGHVASDLHLPSLF
jgi:hypothetical protein